MNSPLVIRNLTKRFGAQTALNAINLEIPAGRVVGLLGRNGAGKSTLFNIACGLVLPSEGSCVTLGMESRDLTEAQLTRLGIVHQEGRFLEVATVRGLLSFTASFYPNWDKSREKMLLKELELSSDRVVGQLSPGDQQKVGIILGVCHHPSLLLLDEPVSALDPIARARMLEFLLTLVREDECTIVISSHILADVEKVVDWITCLDGGEVALSAPLDEVQEGYAGWTVTTDGEDLPEHFPEAYVLSREGDGRQARLCVRLSEGIAQSFAARYRATILTDPLNLERLFPLLIKERRTQP